MVKNRYMFFDKDLAFHLKEYLKKSYLMYILPYRTDHKKDFLTSNEAPYMPLFFFLTFKNTYTFLTYFK